MEGSVNIEGGRRLRYIVYSVYVAPPQKNYLFPYVALFKSVNVFPLTRLVKSKPLRKMRVYYRGEGS